MPERHPGWLKEWLKTYESAKRDGFFLVALNPGEVAVAKSVNGVERVLASRPPLRGLCE